MAPPQLNTSIQALAEIGDDRARFADAGRQKAYAGTAPFTLRRSGRGSIADATVAIVWVDAATPPRWSPSALSRLRGTETVPPDRMPG